MSGSFQQQLQKIITLSEQVLFELSNDVEQQLDEEKQEITEHLISLSKEREALIKLTLNDDQAEKYSQYLPLLNKIVELDRQLTAQSNENKNLIKAKLLKLKKNKKAANTYNKY